MFRNPRRGYYSYCKVRHNFCRVSNIHDVRLLNPLSGEDLTPDIHNNLDNRRLRDPIALRLNVQDASTEQGFSFKVDNLNDDYDKYLVVQCMVFVSEQWEASLCETESIQQLNGASALIDCNCQVLMFFSG